MKLIIKKSIAKIELLACLNAYQERGLTACVDELNTRLLRNKVKFPLLEFCGDFFFEHLSPQEQILFCDQIQILKTESGNVILGIILQKRLTNHFEESIAKVSEYIADADKWYVCDIIGERVFGYSLLHQADKTLPEI